jgi:hypothetical protein
MEGLNMTLASANFHADWVAEYGSRIYLQCRDSFPNETMRFVAKVTAFACNSHSENAQIVRVYYDDKACIYLIDIASTDPNDERLVDIIFEALDKLFGHSMCQPQFTLVPDGNRDSEHYCHMEYLSRECGVSVELSPNEYGELLTKRKERLAAQVN